MTLDGRFEGARPWELDMHATVWGEELEAFSLAQGAEIGTLLFGRRTFEGMARYWAAATGAIAHRMNAAEKVVATRSGTSVAWTNARVLEGEMAHHIAALKAEPGRDIFVFGSADLTATLLACDAVDEIRLCLVPTLLGRGTPLFRPDGIRKDFRLAEARPLRSGGVLMRHLRGAD